MTLTEIKSEKQYQEYLEHVDALLANPPDPNSNEGEHLKAALRLIKAYENANYPIPKPDVGNSR